MITIPTWYSWHHDEHGQAYSLSLSKRAPIMVWNKEVGQMVKIARVGIDEGWQQTEFKKVNDEYKYVPLELEDATDVEE